MARSPAEIQADIALTRRVIERQLDALTPRVPRVWRNPWAMAAVGLGVGCSPWRRFRSCGSGRSAPARWRPGSRSPAPWPPSTASSPNRRAGHRRRDRGRVSVHDHTRLRHPGSAPHAHAPRSVWCGRRPAITKEELLEYYSNVADHLLPFIANRPLSLQRIADPVTGECLYQKTAPAGLPTVDPDPARPQRACRGSATPTTSSAPTCPSLLHLLNLGHIAVHPWSCTVETIDRPDQLLFDLDPIEIAFREVRNAALLVRDLLRHFQIRAWVKTTGGRGLHVMVPLEPHYSFEQVRTAAETITRLARARSLGSSRSTCAAPDGAARSSSTCIAITAGRRWSAPTVSASTPVLRWPRPSSGPSWSARSIRRSSI